MKSWYLFCVFLCLFFSFSSGFGVDDMDKDSTVQYLVQEFQSFRNRVSVLESVIEKQTEIIRVQNDRIIRLEAIVKSRNSGEDDLEKSIYRSPDIEDRINQSRDKNTTTSSLEFDQQNIPASFIPRKVPQERKFKRTVRQSAVQLVAFYAYMSNHLLNPGGHHTLIFDVAETNEGNGYHAHLGVFIVPKSGIYFLSWTMGIDPSSEHSTELVVNNRVHGSIYRDTNDDFERDSVTGNLILNLIEHDEVYIRTGIEYNVGMIISDVYGRSSFSGFLIE